MVLDMKYTKGEWSLDRSYRGCRNIIVKEVDDFGMPLEICDTVGLSNDDEDLANANLIASAPGLHKELTGVQELLSELIQDADTEQAIAKLEGYLIGVNEALAKARGGK